MAEMKKLTAAVREGKGKGAARSVRREGRIPGVIYGGGDAAEPITLDYREVNKLIYAGHFKTTIFEIDVAGNKQRVVPRDYQLDPVKDQPLHVDFLRLKPGAMLRVNVPLHYINQDTCVGIKKGGTLNVVRHVLDMRVPADNMPDMVVADLGPLDVAESFRASTLPIPEGCKLMEEKDFTIATIVPPVVVVVEEAAPVKGKKGKAAPAKAAPAAAAPAKKK